jgi:curli biogenesis system outer membrane secretion channel CsgG
MGGSPEAAATTTTHSQGVDLYEAQRTSYNGPKVSVAIGDFQVKAAGATNKIGDGLREMLMTALFNSNHFIVLDRQAMQDIILEQDLSASRRTKRGTGPKRGKIEGAQIYLYGVVSEFEPNSGGMGISLLSGAIPLGLGAGSKNAHMAIDLRAVDTATSRILFATRVEGETTDYDVGLKTSIGGGSGKIPVSLSKYTNTPMEKAIRVCIDKAVQEFVRKTPTQYYKH